MRAVAALPALIGSWREVGGGLQMSTSQAFAFNRAALAMPELQKGLGVSVPGNIVQKFQQWRLWGMHSLKYGSLPIALATGGIHQIIEDYDPAGDSGYGFLYYDYSSEALWDSIKRAREIFRNRPVWNALIERAMARNFSWEVAVERYEAIYAGILGQSLPMQLTA